MMEKFPKQEPTEEQLESLYETVVSQDCSWDQIRQALEGHTYVSFIATKDFKIYLSVNSHASISNANGLTNNDEYVAGHVWVNYRKNILVNFFYDQVKDKIVIINKIKKFFDSKGIKFE